MTGAYQTTEGLYADSLQNIQGCDSILATTIKINPTFIMEEDVTINEGESIFVGGAEQTVGGTYHDNLFTVNGCDSTIITNLTVITSILDLKSEHNLIISPNPNNGTFNLSLNNMTREEVNLRLMDISGRLIHNERLYSSSSEISHNISLTNIQAGIYLLEVEIHGQVGTEKIVIMK